MLLRATALIVVVALTGCRSSFSLKDPEGWNNVGDTEVESASESASGTESETATETSSATESDTDTESEDPETDTEPTETDTEPPTETDTEPGEVDEDGDGWGVDEDCDDDDAEVNPGADEVCDDIDNDCDGDIDDDDPTVSGTDPWYADDDGDGFGDAGDEWPACEQPVGYVADATDCDDDDAGVNPDADEVCDAVDNDCDGDVDDEDDDVIDPETWYADADEDGFGDPDDQATGCDAPSGYVGDDQDCDDDEDAINPDATEVCNEIDDDCDGAIDDDDTGLNDTDIPTWYADDDGDGYGDDTGLPVPACDQPSGFTTTNTDCDDSDASINPGESESCNGRDDDCDGVADSSSVCPCDVEYDTGDYEHPYMLCQTTRSWTSARSQCSSYDYHLADIEDLAENLLLDTLVDSYSSDEWWVGYNDRSTEGTFVWDGGSSATWTNWHVDEPNDSGGEDCTELNRWADGTWNDADCSDSKYYVCEFER